MKTRTSNLVVCGLVIIIFVLMFYYMSCESKAIGLERISEGFEEKIRTLTMSNVGHEETIQAILSNKHILENDNADMKTQIRRKTLEIEGLNEKVEHTLAELENMKNVNKKLVAKYFAMKLAHKGLQSNDRRQDAFTKELNNLREQLRVFQGNVTAPSSVNGSVLAVMHSDVMDEDLDDSDAPENLLKLLNGVLPKNETQTITTTTRTTTVLPLIETDIGNDEDVHDKKIEEEPEPNQLV